MPGQLEMVFSPVDETPVFTLTGGIFKDAPHPNAAKLYLTWFLAKEQQSRVGSFSSRADVPPPEGFQPLTSYKIANNYREFMTDEKLVAELRKRFEKYTGTAGQQGRRPLGVGVGSSVAGINTVWRALKCWVAARRSATFNPA